MTANGKAFFIILLSALASLTLGEEWWKSGRSVQITLDNFDEYIGKDKHVIVEMFAPYCFYCKMVQPEWDILAEHYMGENENRKDVLIAKIDGAAEPQFVDRFGVNGFPGFILFKKGDIFPGSRYYQDRTAKNFITWIENAIGPYEKPEVKEDLDSNFLTVDDIQQDNIDNVDAPGDVKTERSLSGDQDIDSIVEKLDFLVDLVNNNGIGHSGSDMKDLKSLISDIDHKITSKSASPQEDINFSHGISFLLLGLFLGIGISFGVINYQKLTRPRKLLVD